ncbi:family 16 glycosylhydrolase [Streptomyces sp. NPDC058417]|uniref:glycoside hydrolase family 16 protein n=1 Tax=unclassified Streptomyces TaxID=2593676 RepID=UPI003650E0A5
MAVAGVVSAVGLLATAVPAASAPVSAVPESARTAPLAADAASQTCTASSPDQTYPLPCQQRVFHDGFDGDSLDTDKWNVRKTAWSNDSNVSVSGGNLLVDMKRVSDSTGRDGFRGGGISSKEKFGYGYYEIKATIPELTPGWHPAFWTQIWDGAEGRPVYGRPFTELDIFETQSVDSTTDPAHPKGYTKLDGGVITWNNSLSGNDGSDKHYPRYSWAEGNDNKQPWTEEHRYGLDYSADYLTFVLDGRPVKRVRNPITNSRPFPYGQQAPTAAVPGAAYNSPMSIWVTAILTTATYVAEEGKPVGHSYGTFEVDDVSYYAPDGEVPPLYSDEPLKDTIESVTETFDDGDEGWWKNAGSTWSVVPQGDGQVLRNTTTGREAVALTGRPLGYPAHQNVAHPDAWRNVSVKARLTLDSATGGGAGVVARAQNAKNGYALRLEPKKQRVRLVKEVDGVTTVLATRSLPVTAGTAYDLELVADGSTLTGYVNGVQKVTAQDSALVKGKAGVIGQKQPFSVSQVEVAERTGYSPSFDRWWQSTPSWVTPTTADSVRLLRNTAGAGDAVAVFGRPTTFGPLVDEPNARGWDDVEVEGRVTLEPGSASGGDAGLVARYQDAANHYYLRLQPGQDQVSLVRKAGGTSTVLASSPLDLATGTAYDLRLVVKGDTVSGYVGGVLKVTGTDTSLTTGRAGVKGHDQLFTVSQVRAVQTDATQVPAFADWTKRRGLWTASGDTFTSIFNAANREAIATAARPASGSQPTAWNDVTVEGRITLTSATGEGAGLIARYSDADHYYYLKLLRTSASTKKIQVVKTTVPPGSTDGKAKATVIASKDVDIQPDTPIDLKFTVQGGNLLGYVDGVAQVSVRDSTPLPAGDIGARAYNQPFTLTDVKAYDSELTAPVYDTWEMDAQAPAWWNTTQNGQTLKNTTTAQDTLAVVGRPAKDTPKADDPYTQDWSGFTAEADVTLDGTSGGGAALVGRYQDDKNLYYLTLAPNQGDQTGALKLEKIRNGKRETLATQPLSVTYGTPYRLKLAIEGVDLTGSASTGGGAPVTLQARDSDVSSGRVGVRGFQQAFSVSNVRISPTYRLTDTFDGASDWTETPAASWKVISKGSGYAYRSTAASGDATAFIGKPYAPAKSEAVPFPVQEQNELPYAPEWTNFKVEADVTLDSAGQGAGVTGRTKDANNLYALRLRPDTGQVVLVRKLNGVTTVLAAAPQTVAVGTKYALKLVVEDNTLTGYVDGVRKVTADDFAFGVGRVGLTGTDQPFTTSRLKVTALG